MPNVTHRLKAFLTLKSLSVNEFETLIEVSQGTVGKTLSGKTNFAYTVLGKIFLKYPELNIDWLITGRGEMLTSKDYQENEVPQVEAAEAGTRYEPARPETGTDYREKYLEILEKYTTLLEANQVKQVVGGGKKTGQPVG